MSRKESPYVVDLLKCHDAAVDGRGHVALHRGIGMDVDSEVTDGINRQYRCNVNTNSSGRDVMSAPRRRFSLIRDDTSSTLVNTISQRLSTVDGCQNPEVWVSFAKACGRS